MIRSDEQETHAPAGAVVGPLGVWALAAVLGAAAGERLATRGLGPSWLWGLLALGAGLAVIVAALPLASGIAAARHRGALATLAVIVVLAGAAGLRLVVQDGGLLVELAGRGGAAELRLVVSQEPRPTADGWHVDVRVQQVDGLSTREGAAIRLDDGPDVAPPALGERWTLTASARPVPEGGYGRWLSRRHARVLLDPVRVHTVDQPGPLAGASEHVRERIRRTASAHNPEAVGGLLVGLVTGDLRLLPDDARAAMEATSLTHLTAVSGTHVAVLVAGVLGVCGLLRLGAAGRRRAVLAALVGFAYLTRFEPSVLRAGTMGAVLLLAFARGVPRDARHALAAAVLLLVLIDPMLASTLGLLLSATATAGVLVIAPRVSERLARVPGIPRRLADLTGVTVGAQLAVVPLLLASFGEVPLASVPANLLAVPAGALAAALGFVGAGLAAVHPASAAMVFAAAGLPARVVLRVADTLAGRGGVVDAGRPLAVVALVALGAWLCTREGGRPARAAAGVALVAVTAAGIGGLLPRAPVTTLTVTAIDVGQGDAFLVESPRARILVDAGEDDTAATWLGRHGPSRLDLAVVTHPHLDHVGGMASVLRTVEVGQLWYRPMPNELGAVDEMLGRAADAGVEVRAPVAGERARVGDLDLEILSPGPGRPYRHSGSELNDSSIVVRAHWRQRRVLLTGDVEHAAQRDLLEEPASLRAEAFTVPHHGAGTSEAEFLRAVGAQVGLIGVGRDNRHGHPHPDVLDVLASSGVEVVRTDEHGTTRVEVPAPAPAPTFPADAHAWPGGDGPVTTAVGPGIGSCAWIPCTCSSATTTTCCDARSTTSSRTCVPRTPKSTSRSTMSPRRSACPSSVPSRCSVGDRAWCCAVSRASAASSRRSSRPTWSSPQRRRCWCWSRAASDAYRRSGDWPRSTAPAPTSRRRRTGTSAGGTASRARSSVVRAARRTPPRSRRSVPTPAPMPA